MKTFKLLLVLTISIAIMLIVIQNKHVIQVRFLWFTGEMPAILLLFLTSAGGFALGIIVTLLVRSGKKHQS